MSIFLASCASLDIQQAHRLSLRRHRYITDIDQYGKIDVWTPSLVGDCEDYALFMKKNLGGELLYVVTNEGVPHVVLDVDGIIIDSLYANVYQIKDIEHKILFRIDDEMLKRFIESRSK